jgi:hypothetical protein
MPAAGSCWLQLYLPHNLPDSSHPPCLLPPPPPLHRVTLVEAKELLGSFDGSLREYAARKLVKQGILLRKVGEG